MQSRYCVPLNYSNGSHAAANTSTLPYCTRRFSRLGENISYISKLQYQRGHVEGAQAGKFLNSDIVLNGLQLVNFIPELLKHQLEK